MSASDSPSSEPLSKGHAPCSDSSGPVKLGQEAKSNASLPGVCVQAEARQDPLLHPRWLETELARRAAHRVPCSLWGRQAWRLPTPEESSLTSTPRLMPCPWPLGIQLPEEVTQGWLCSPVPLLTERANAIQSPRSSRRSLGLGTKRVETTKVSDHCGDVSSHL